MLVIKTETTKRRGEEKALFLTGRLFGAECPYKVLAIKSDNEGVRPLGADWALATMAALTPD